MAIIQTGDTEAYNRRDLRGLSTDIKPITNVGEGSTFYELDTKILWDFSLVNINPLTGDGWW